MKMGVVGVDARGGRLFRPGVIAVDLRDEHRSFSL